MFSDAIRAAYRVVETKHGGGDGEETIPLGSWRKGGGLAGSRGHVYEHGPASAGVWIIGQGPQRRMEALRVQFPDLRIMQIGAREGTFSVPMGNLDRLLPILKAKRRFKASEGQLAASRKGAAASPLIPKARPAHRHKPKNEPG